MAEGTLTKMSVLCSLVGIAILYVGTIQARPGLTPIAKIDEDYVGLNTIISGQVIDLRVHPAGHLFMKLKDGSGGVISVPVFDRVRAELGENIELLDNVQVLGEVELYNDELELIPRNAIDIRVVHTPHTVLSTIDNSRLGELIKIRGEVSERRIVGNGNLLLTVREDGAELLVFASSSVVSEDSFPEVHEGNTIRVGGLLQDYEGELELKLEDPANIGIIEAS